jgi:hypothetical protein
MLTHVGEASLELTAQERGDLEAIVASRRLPHGLVRCANMILLAESGVLIRETAQRLNVTPPAVTKWRKRFREQCLAGLHDQLKSDLPASPGKPSASITAPAPSV